MSSYTSKDALRPVLASALEAIKRAERAGSPLSHDQLRQRLGYRGRGAVIRVTRELRDMGLVTLTSAQPGVLKATTQEAGQP